MAAYIPRVNVIKPVGALVTLTRRLTDSSNTLALTVNKNTVVTVQNEGAPPPSPWRAGAWKVGV